MGRKRRLAGDAREQTSNQTRDAKRIEQSHVWAEAVRQQKPREAGLGPIPELLHYVADGLHLAKTIHETHTANQFGATVLGARHALSHILYDVEHSHNPHIDAGEPYTGEKLNERVANSALAKEKNDMLSLLGVENKDAPKHYKDGVGLVADLASAALRLGKTPADRLANLTQSADKARAKLAELQKSRQAPEAQE